VSYYGNDDNKIIMMLMMIITMIIIFIIIGGAIGNAATAWSIFLLFATYILRKLYPKGVKLLEKIKNDTVNIKHHLDEDIDKIKHNIEDGIHDVKIKIQHDWFGRSIDRNGDDDDDDDDTYHQQHIQNDYSIISNTSVKKRYTSNKIHPINDIPSSPPILLPSSSLSPPPS
jgi:ABC-type multidrug transport system fused ATPase/permease subunit